MRKIIVSLLLTLLISAVSVAFSDVYAAECTSVEQCVNGRTCVERNGGRYGDEIVIVPVGAPCGGGIIGGIEPPQSILRINTLAGDTETIGIVFFANRIIVLITIIAGIWVMFNFIRAGWMFLAAGDNTKATGEVRDLLTYSIIGLVIIAVAYTIAGLVGLLFFGDAGFILNPELYSAV